MVSSCVSVILVVVCAKQVAGTIPQEKSIIIATLNTIKSEARPNSLATETVFVRQDEDEDETSKAPLIPWSTPRIHDFASGLTGIIQGLFKGNPEKFLEGSLEFIPPGVRGGVKGILGSIAGRPIAETKTTTVAPALKTTTIDGEGFSEEEEVEVI